MSTRREVKILGQVVGYVEPLDGQWLPTYATSTSPRWREGEPVETRRAAEQVVLSKAEFTNGGRLSVSLPMLLRAQAMCLAEKLGLDPSELVRIALRAAVEADERGEDPFPDS